MSVPGPHLYFLTTHLSVYLVIIYLFMYVGICMYACIHFVLHLQFHEVEISWCLQLHGTHGILFHSAVLCIDLGHWAGTQLSTWGIRWSLFMLVDYCQQQQHLLKSGKFVFICLSLWWKLFGRMGLPSSYQKLCTLSDWLCLENCRDEMGLQSLNCYQ